MLLNLREYERPAARGGDLADVLSLLARTSIRTVPLAGGNTLVASSSREIEAVVDLQGLGLDKRRVSSDGRTIQIGAMVTRAQLATWSEKSGSEDALPPPARQALEFLGTAAKRWSGSVQRNRATVGGAAVGSAPTDPLVAALLAFNAAVTIRHRDGAERLPFANFIPQRAALLSKPAVVIEVEVIATQHTGCGLSIVARTPADEPIVLAAACAIPGMIRLVLGGVAEAPLVIEDASSRAVSEIAITAANSTSPNGDFRGSAEYRQEMARVLAERALTQALEGVRQ